MPSKQNREFLPEINHEERKPIGSLITLIVVVFGFYALFPPDAMTLQSGYSVLWLIVLYLCGGWIRLYGSSIHPKRFWLMVWLLSSAAMLVCKLISDYPFLHYDFRILERLYSTCSSPLVLCSAARKNRTQSAFPAQTVTHRFHRRLPSCSTAAFP
jgi:hypothetical protein